MSLARLRRILRSQLEVQIVSSEALAQGVQAQVAARSQELLQKGKPLPVFKPVTLLPDFHGMVWQVRPVKLLHKLGRMTTPAGLGNMAKLSAGWATRRYFWAIAEASVNNQRFRLSQDAIDLDFHQKQLLSDEFGMAMAGLFMEQQLGAPDSMDVSLALRDELLAQQIEKSGRKQPDYIMWNEQANPTYFVVECKGSQGPLSETLWQLRGGLEQLPSINFVDPARHAGSFVIATRLGPKQTFLYLIDPPPDDPAHNRFRGEKVSERTGTRVTVTNVPELEKRTRIGKATQVLQWAGQNRRALAIREQLEHPRDVEPLPDMPINTREIEGAEYQGQIVPLFPELSTELRVFLGVDQRLLIAADQHGEIPFAVSHAVAQQRLAPGNQIQEAGEVPEAFESISLDGTCMRVEGLPD